MLKKNLDGKGLKSMAKATKELGISSAGLSWIKQASAMKLFGNGANRGGNAFAKAFVSVSGKDFVDMEIFYRCMKKMGGGLPLDEEDITDHTELFCCMKCRRKIRRDFLKFNGEDK